jgi:hypothetical protein
MVAHHTVKKLRRLRKTLAKTETKVEVLRARILVARLAVRKHAMAEGLDTDSDSGSSSSSSDSDDDAEDDAAVAGSSHQIPLPLLGIDNGPELQPEDPTPEVTERALVLVAEPGLAPAALIPSPELGPKPMGRCTACWYRTTKKTGGPKHNYDQSCDFSAPRVRRVL